MIRKFLAASAQTLGDREVVVVASTDDVDRVGEIVDVEGIDLAAYRANPIVLWNHDPAHPVGTATSIGAGAGALRATVQFAPEGASHIADTTCSLVKAGIVVGVSIGFDAIETEPMDPSLPRGPQRYLATELLEISFVSIPANEAATVVQRALNVGRRAEVQKKVAALHRRWRAAAASGRRLTYDERLAETLREFGIGTVTERNHGSAQLSFAERQEAVRRLAPKQPVFDGDVVKYAAEMRDWIERRFR